jgi:hypothetical protein
MHTQVYWHNSSPLACNPLSSSLKTLHTHTTTAFFPPASASPTPNASIFFIIHTHTHTHTTPKKLPATKDEEEMR